MNERNALNSGTQIAFEDDNHGSPRYWILMVRVDGVLVGIGDRESEFFGIEYNPQTHGWGVVEAVSGDSAQADEPFTDTWADALHTAERCTIDAIREAIEADANTDTE